MVKEEVKIFECISAIIMRNLNSKKQVAVIDSYLSNISPLIFGIFIFSPLFAVFGSARPEIANEIDFSKILMKIIDANII